MLTVIGNGNNKKNNIKNLFKAYISVTLDGTIIEYVGPDIVPIKKAIKKSLFNFISPYCVDIFKRCQRTTLLTGRQTVCSIIGNWQTDKPYYRTMLINRDPKIEDVVNVIVRKI